WKGSSAFTHLISVDLPLPEGPHTTTTSPFATSVAQSVSTWNEPYHLLTRLISIIAMIVVRSGSQLADNRDPFLDALHQHRKAVGDREVYDRDEGVHLDQAIVAGGDLRGGTEEIGRGDHIEQRRGLEQDHGLGGTHGQHS